MNPHIEAFHREYRSTVGHVALPPRIAEAYEVCACLREANEKATYLIRTRQDGQPYILKTARASGKASLAPEYAFLCALSHPSVPRAVGWTEWGDMQYLIREYVEGEPLDQLVSASGPMDGAAAARVVLQLCDALHSLHSQRPPIIHRDIKPQNVLLTAEGRCALIDFGIARRFDASASGDTVCMGTQATAAPEQFGYMQTGVRSDVYSTGVLLLYLLTGSCDLGGVCDISDRALRGVVRRCVRFDPADRYPSVLRLRRGLTRALHRKRRLAALLGAAALAALGIAALPLTLPRPPAAAAVSAPPAVSPAALADEAGYVFASPLIEAAVRHELGMDDSTPVTREDLSRVTKILICGETIYDEWDEHSISGTYDYLNGERAAGAGTIRSLADIAYMENLTELAVFNQRISDLSPLRGLRLTRLGLGGNRIGDVSALPDCGAITHLLLNANPLEDIGPLSKIPSLVSLELSKTRVTSIAPLSGLPLAYLSLLETPVSDYAPLIELPQLEWVRLSDLPSDQLPVCGELFRLKDLMLQRCGVTDLALIRDLTELVFLAVPDNGITDLRPIASFPKLNGLCLEGNPVGDLSALAALKNLEYINLIGVDTADFSVLSELPALRRLDCTADQLEGIERALGGKDVQISAR